jgi:hypothetical protein
MVGTVRRRDQPAKSADAEVHAFVFATLKRLGKSIRLGDLAGHQDRRCPTPRIGALPGRRDPVKSCAVMIRFLLRFIGLWTLAVAFIALIRDGTRTIAGSAVAVTKLEADWYNFHPNSLQSLQPAIEKHVVWLWNPVIQSILEQPTWLVLGVAGAVMVVLGRKKKPLIGYARD